MSSPSINPVLLLVGLISLSGAITSIRRFIKHESGFSLLKLIVHLMIAGAMMIVAWFPQSARAATKYLGFGENLNTLIFVAFLIQFVMIYKLARTVEVLEGRIVKLTQKISLNKTQ
ncbi:MAG: DUF2304 domain-containing protein [Candidatus Roizmanbacteria bacterium]